MWEVLVVEVRKFETIRNKFRLGHFAVFADYLGGLNIRRV